MQRRGIKDGVKLNHNSNCNLTFIWRHFKKKPIGWHPRPKPVKLQLNNRLEVYAKLWKVQNVDLN